MKDIKVNEELKELNRGNGYIRWNNLEKVVNLLAIDHNVSKYMKTVNIEKKSEEGKLTDLDLEHSTLTIYKENISKYRKFLYNGEISFIKNPLNEYFDINKYYNYFLLKVILYEVRKAHHLRMTEINTKNQLDKNSLLRLMNSFELIDQKLLLNDIFKKRERIDYSDRYLFELFKQIKLDDEREKMLLEYSLSEELRSKKNCLIREDSLQEIRRVELSNLLYGYVRNSVKELINKPDIYTKYSMELKPKEVLKEDGEVYIYGLNNEKIDSDLYTKLLYSAPLTLDEYQKVIDIYKELLNNKHNYKRDVKSLILSK